MLGMPELPLAELEVVYDKNANRLCHFQTLPFDLDYKLGLASAYF